MNKKSLRNIFFIYIILLCAFIIWCRVSPYPKSITISLAQYVICLFLFFLLFTIKSIRESGFFSKIKYIFPLILILLFLSEYFDIFKSENKILFSRFPKDKYEILSSRARDIINKRLKGSTLKVKRTPFLIKNDNEARSFLNKGYSVVIWKDKRNINVSFEKLEDIKINDVLSSEKEYTIISDISKLKVPSNTQGFYKEQDLKRFRNTYNDPILAPSIFISNLLYKLNEDEIKLKEIYYQKFLWKQSTHLAYPYFLIGTKYLKDYKETKEMGNIFCAIKNYRKALMYIRKHDQEELYFAIINNLMVSYFLEYEETQKPIYKRKGKSIFKKSFPLPSYVDLENKLIFLENGIIFSNRFE